MGKILRFDDASLKGISPVWSPDCGFQDDEEEDGAHRQPALPLLYAATARGIDLSGDRAGQPTMRLIQRDSIQKSKPLVLVGGINIHAAAPPA